MNMFNLKKSLVYLTLALGLFAVGIPTASAAGKDKPKNYQMTVRSDTKVGSVVLKAGDYKFKFEDSNAVFTRQNSGTVYTAPAKLETGTEKFAQTMIHQVKDGDQSRIIGIDLKGSQDHLKFD
jgi:hypothetical protein